jgi:hypothetical protein
LMLPASGQRRLCGLARSQPLHSVQLPVELTRGGTRPSNQRAFPNELARGISPARCIDKGLDCERSRHVGAAEDTFDELSAAVQRFTGLPTAHRENAEAVPIGGHTTTRVKS